MIHRKGVAKAALFFMNFPIFHICGVVRNDELEKGENANAIS